MQTLSTFGIFLLAILGLVGTILIVADPSGQLAKKMHGRKGSQVKEDLESWADEKDSGDIILAGCRWAFFILTAILYTFVVEPWVAISALVNNIGNQYAAYAMLAIIAISWLRWVKLFIPKKEKEDEIFQEIRQSGVDRASEELGADVAEAADFVYNDIERRRKEMALDKTIDLGNPAWRFVKRVFFSLPTLYIWYVFVMALMPS